MAGNNTQREERRELVANLRLHGLSIREITDALLRAVDPATGKPLYVNPRTGKPYSMRVVVDDLAAIDEQWQQRYAELHEKRAARLAAGLEALRQDAWKAEDRKTVLATYREEMKLFGLSAPEKIAPTDPAGVREFGADRLTDEQLAAEVDKILERERTGSTQPGAGGA